MMNRRGFLQLLGAGLPAAVVCEKVGLLERVRTYFFAPQVGWNQLLTPVGFRIPLEYSQISALQLEQVRVQLPTLYERDDVLFKMVGTKAQTRIYRRIEWDKAITL